MVDLATLVEETRKPRRLGRGRKLPPWQLVSLESGDVDVLSSVGALNVGVRMAVSEWERLIISERTRAALAARRAVGVVLGRRPTLAPAIRAKIVRMRDRSGLSWPTIAAKLNKAKEPTAQARGLKRWYPSSVRHAYLYAKHGTSRPAVTS
jgi:hypothetical protein